MKTGRIHPAIVALALFAAWVAAGGCTTKSRARAEAQKAFQAGQQQAEMQAEARRNNVAFLGPVLNPVVPWSEGLTLARAIVAARWSGLQDPHLIVLMRDGERVELNPAEALAAANMPLFPGDTVELVP